MTNSPSPLPAFVKSVSGEVDDSYWKPQNFKEWAAYSKTSAYLTLWTRQQKQEQDLRRAIGIWVFTLITLQVMAIFLIVILDSSGKLTLNIEISKFLIPSVLAEVFGMGFLVVKYLFRANSDKAGSMSTPK